MTEKTTSWKFNVAGVKFHDLNTCINELEVGQELALVPEPDNKFDPNAVKIIYLRNDEEVMIGYVPAKISAEVSAELEISDDIICIITAVNPNAKSWEQLQVEILHEVEDIEDENEDDEIPEEEKELLFGDEVKY